MLFRKFENLKMSEKPQTLLYCSSNTNFTSFPCIKSKKKNFEISCENRADNTQVPKQAVSFEHSIGANPESKTGDGWTPLHCASYWGNYEVVGILLSHGVDVNSRSEISFFPS
jgi:ankyrin repeat protein